MGKVVIRNFIKEGVLLIYKFQKNCINLFYSPSQYFNILQSFSVMHYGSASKVMN